MAPMADSGSSVMDDSPNHSDNPLAAPVCVLASDHASQAGIVVGMVLVAMIVVTAIQPWWLNATARSVIYGYVNPSSIILDNISFCIVVWGFYHAILI